MILDKKLVDEVIRINKKYFKTGDSDILPSVINAEKELELKGKVSSYVVALIGDLAKYTQVSDNGTYNDIYKALAIFGVIVE